MGVISDSSAYLEHATIRVDRTPFTLPATRTLRDFYDPPDVVQDQVRFSWGPVHDPGTEPEPTWALSMIRLAPIVPGDTTVVPQNLWNIISPADREGFVLPSIPQGAPGPDAGLIDVGETPEEDRLVLDVNLANPSGTLADILIAPSRDVTHLSRRSATLLLDPSAAPDPGIAHAPAPAVRPNPSRGEVTLTLGNGRAGAVEPVSILDVTGRLVRELSGGVQDGRLVWDGTDARGRAVPPGIYLLVVGEGAERRSTKIHRIR
ncbi:MAG: hypothetical protein GF346_01145 [Candidatus Eisenbacteria bacterium]|nr:hypothetical protein [Candidatus Latescibacterota bacterium]MBD3301035.1 hypothetical protein [Candidatus Eisenbacteria bacterium]